jgi:PKD repeat protein
MNALSQLVCSIAATTTLATAQFQTTLPDNHYNTNEGNSNFVLPWNVGANGGRVQFVHDSSLFTGTGMNGPIRITGVRYRPDAIANSAPGGTYPSVDIDLSTCVSDYTTLSNTFANNHGADRTNVYSGPVIVQPFTGGSAPLPFYVTVNFTTPFVYDASLGGDLLLDFQVNPGWTGPAPGAVDHVAATGVPPPRASRVWISGSPTAPTGNASFSPTYNVSPVCEFLYEPATGLWANFAAATTTTGATPLTVNFADRSVTSDPNGVVLWQWDLDGDGITDSNLQNPSFVYTNCGSYNVSLTVFDGTHGPATTTKVNFVVTDQVQADFSWMVIGGNVVAFTDLTVPPATSWSWDLDGDGIVDSTAQNPVWAYTSGCNAWQVSLTANRGCGPTSTTTRAVALAPHTLTTQLTGGSGFFGSGSGNLFDLAVLNPTGINLCAVTNCPYSDGTLPIGAPLQCQVYITDAPGGFSANHNNAAVWRLAATGTGRHRGGNSGSPVPITMTLDRSIYLPAGNYGMAIYMIGAGIAFRVGNTTAANADLSITAGSAKSGVFNASQTLTRAWSGTLHYDTLQSLAGAGFGFFGSGCAGSLGIGRIQPQGVPALGSTFNVTVDRAPASAAFVMLGFSRTASVFGPLPLDGAALGAPGCFGRVSSDAVAFFTGTGNQVVWSLAIPNAPGFLGLVLYQQALLLDPGLNALGTCFSDAAALFIGN